MSTAEKKLSNNLLRLGGRAGVCTMFETASTVMQRRIGRSAIRNRRDLAARDPRGEDQRGITLQTLIVTSVVVFLAIAVSFTLFAINAGHSEDLEGAGKSGQAADSCRPNEIFDIDYESKGLGGTQNQGGVESSQIGCRPHCATWEFMTAAPNDEGEYKLSKDWLLITQANVGGPEGNEGVFSTRTGCFAPCYWEHGSVSGNYPRPRELYDADSRLHYFDDNRHPAGGEFRLGVVYNRGSRGDAHWVGTDIILRTHSVSYNRDGKHTFRKSTVAGTPLTPTQREGWRNQPAIPTVTPPNWYTSSPNRNHASWEDEDWEVRANAKSETCEIVNTARNDELVCTSARESCAPVV